MTTSPDTLQSSRSALEPGDRPLRILVVDDDELDRLAVRRCLAQSGLPAQTDEAESAPQTLEKIAAAVYDCILLDYYLPGVSGLSLLRDIRAAAPETPVLIFTGRGDEDIAVELMKSGAADYLPKASLTPERLLSGLRHALEVTAAAAARRRAESMMKLLSEAAQHLLTAGDPEELVRGLFEKIKAPLGVDAFFNCTTKEFGDDLRLVSFGGIPQGADALQHDVGQDISISGTVAATRRPMHVTHIQQSQEPMVQPIKSLGMRACFCHPLLAEYRLLGTLAFATSTKDEFAPDELEFLKTVSHYATAAYERLRHIVQLRESDRRKDEFLATLAHELRDPLAPLRNVLELLKRASRDNGSLRRASDMMERQLGQMMQLVEDLLDVSRITRNKLEIRRRAVDLASIVNHAVETARPLAEAAKHELEVVLPSEPVQVEADPVRLAQVFANLLTNACKYTEPNGRVRLMAERQGPSVVVTVSDTGIGIPPDKLASVFDMFSQVQSTLDRSQGGLGIGLTLVKRLVAMHDGTVEAKSEGSGHGSEFIVRLPILENDRTGTPSAVEAPHLVEGRRILIVDDNQDSASSLAMLLTVTGNAAREAYDGLAAVEAADQFRPDIVLLDIGLPKLNGYDVCRRLREQPWGRDMIIVALTGWGQDEDRRKSEEAGFDFHMVKPVDYTALMKLLGDA